MEQVIIQGRLLGIEENKLSLEAPGGGMKVYPRKELEVSLEWVFAHLERPVICILRDGVATELRESLPANP